MILAIETSGVVASVAVVGKDKKITEFTINNKLTHSQILMTMIQSMLDLAEIDLKSIEYIACSNGPGSFTGLRIGAATAKGLAVGMGKNIIPVSALDALAYNVVQFGGLICPVMDARRGEVYTALFQNGVRITDYMAVKICEILDITKEYNSNVIFVGDGTLPNIKTIKEILPNCTIAHTGYLMQSASSVGFLAQKMFEKNTQAGVEPGDFELYYIRKSEAERKLAND